MFLCLFVALLTESVDWNCLPKDVYNMITGRSPHGERGLKSNQLNISLKTSMSLSSRRAWIEIATVIDTCRRNCVALLTESVDWNFIVADVLDKIPASLSSRRAWIEMFCKFGLSIIIVPSLSSRRAWIEIAYVVSPSNNSLSRSPHGERGLKSFESYWHERKHRRSPHGERGLKFSVSLAYQLQDGVALLTESVDWNSDYTIILTEKGASLSSRRAWIEMSGCRQYLFCTSHVALLTESVDWNPLRDN